MDFEKQFSDAERLSEEAAHDEANMIRAKARINPETGQKHSELTPMYKREAGGIREASAEDYESAFKALQELRKDVEENPEGNAERILKGLGNLAALSPLIAGSLMERITKTLSGGPGMSPKMGERWEQSKEKTDKFIDQAFSDAQSQLERLQKKGEEFAEREIQHDIQE